jgi:hypothetical protein
VVVRRKLTKNVGIFRLQGFTTHILRYKQPDQRGPSAVCVCICSNVHYGGMLKLADELAEAALPAANQRQSKLLVI